MSGWYAIKRGTISHELFAPVGKWSKFEAWNWMIEAAAYKPTVIDIGGKPYTVPRGALCFSQRFLATKFKWSKKALTTFLETLESHRAIELGVVETGTGTRSKRTQITLCNYDKYQASGTKTEPKGGQKGTKEEQVNNIPVGGADKSAPDLASQIFGQGLAYLKSCGVKDKNARSLLGKWRKQHGDGATIEALGKSQREGAIDPVQYVEGVFRFQRPKAADGKMAYARGEEWKSFL